MKDLEFGIRWKLNTTEVSNAADKIVGSIGTITSAIVGLLASGFQFDNFLGVVNTKINNIDGSLIRFRGTLESVINTQNKYTSGLSVDTMQKIGMSFVTQSTIGEKYSSDLRQNMQNYQNSSGMLIKGMDFTVGEATNSLTSFRKTLLLSYEEMPKFSSELVTIAKTSNLTAKETKTLIDQSVKLARAYGLAGEEGKEFVKNQLVLTSTLSQLGLEADSVQRKLNAMTDGSEEGAVQAMLLGYDPLGDQTNTASMLKDKASQLMGMVEGMPVQMQSMMIKGMAPSMGLGAFGIDDLRQMALGGSEKAKEEGLTPEKINKEIYDYLRDPARSGEDFYKTAGQGLTDAVKSLQMLFMHKFQPALEDLKAGLETFKTVVIPKIDKFIDNVLGFVSKIQKLLGYAGKEGGFGNLATTAVLAASAIMIVQAIITSSIGLMITTVGGLITGSLTAVTVGSVLAVVLSGLTLGYIVGSVINHFLSSETKQKIGDIAFSLMPDWVRKMVGAPTREEVNSGTNIPLSTQTKTLGQKAAESREKTQSTTGNWERTDISKLGEQLGLKQTSNNQADFAKNILGRAEHSFHKTNQAEDFSVKGLNPQDILQALNTFESKGFNAKFETSGAKPEWLPEKFYMKNAGVTDHLHVQEIRKTEENKQGPKTELATSDNGSDKVLKVKDVGLSENVKELTNAVKQQQQQIAIYQQSATSPQSTSWRENPHGWNPGVNMMSDVANEGR